MITIFDNILKITFLYRAVLKMLISIYNIKLRVNLICDIAPASYIKTDK